MMFQIFPTEEELRAHYTLLQTHPEYPTYEANGKTTKLCVNRDKWTLTYFFLTAAGKILMTNTHFFNRDGSRLIKKFKTVTHKYELIEVFNEDGTLRSAHFFDNLSVNTVAKYPLYSCEKMQLLQDVIAESDPRIGLFTCWMN